MTKKFSIIFLLIISVCFSKNLLTRYNTVRFDGTDSIMPNHYTGPLFMTGCADTDMNKIIKKDVPTEIGIINSKKITLFGDTTYPEEIYSFDSISYYEVATNTDTFYIIYTKALKNSMEYEIIVELNYGGYYDRTINIFKDGKPYTLILWKENLRLVKSKRKEI